MSSPKKNDCEVSQKNISISVESKNKELEVKGKSGILGAGSNLFNSVIGVGIIALPEALKKGGLWFGIISSLICVLFIYYCSVLMIKSAEKGNNINSYGELCKQSIGVVYFYILCVMVFSLMFGAMIVYNIIFKQEISDIISDFTKETFQHEKWVLAGCSLVLMLIPSLWKDISRLKFVSFVSTFGVFTIIIILIARSPIYNKAYKSMTPEKMIVIEKNLNLERAIWLCSLPQKDDSLNSLEFRNWPNTYKVTNSKNILDKLHENDACLMPIKKDEILNLITAHNSVSSPVLDESNVGPLTWNDVIANSHAKYLYDNWSLNEDGRNKRDFSLFGFARINAFSALGVFAAAFIAQQSTFSIYNSLEKRTLKQFHKVSLVGFVAIYLACIVLALTGYLSQQYQVETQVFTKMKPRYLGLKSPDIYTNVGRIILVLTIALTYPMQMFFGRVFLVLVIRAIMEHFNYDSQSRKVLNWLHYTTTLSMFGIALIIGLFFDQAGAIYTFIGALFASPMIYIFPVACWYSLEGGYVKTVKSALKDGGSKIFWNVALPGFIFIFGVFSTILSTVNAILDAFGIKIIKNAL